MPLLFRYCLKALWPPFFVATGVVLFLLNLLFYLLTFLQYLLHFHAGVVNSFLLLVYIQPGFIVLAIPIGFLVALLVVFGRLSADGEVIAMESCGFSIKVLVWPMVGVALLLSLFLVAFMDTFLPWGNTSFLKLDYRVKRERLSVVIKERVFINDFEGYLLYVDQKDEKDNLLKGVKLQALDDKQYPYRTIYAKEGQFRQDPSNFHTLLDLSDGTMQQIGTKKNDEKLEEFFQMKFQTCTLDLSAGHLHYGPMDFRDARNISAEELAALIKEKKSKNQDTRYEELEFQKKFSLPFSALAFAFIGIPLGLSSRTGFWANVFFAVVLVVVYELFIMFGEAGGPMGVISPFLGMWLPNFVLSIIGLLLVRRLIRRHDFWKLPFTKTLAVPDSAVRSSLSWDRRAK